MAEADLQVVKAALRAAAMCNQQSAIGNRQLADLDR
jgi:hypothetical protein